MSKSTTVLFVIRTFGSPLCSRPSRPLAIITVVIVLIGLGLPFTPLVGVLSFAALPLGYFVFLAAATAMYLLLVQ